VIHQLRLRNFKGVVEGEAELDKLTILVGPNNSGKTTILEALFLAPNPLRQVPYVPTTAVQLLLEYHKTLSEKGYTFLLNKYIANNMVIKVDDRELLFTKDLGQVSEYIQVIPPGYFLLHVNLVRGNFFIWDIYTQTVMWKFGWMYKLQTIPYYSQPN
jgi:GTPase SAR1 family protein